MEIYIVFHMNWNYLSIAIDWCECNLISHYKEEALLLTEEFVEQLFFFWDHWESHISLLCPSLIFMYSYSYILRIF